MAFAAEGAGALAATIDALASLAMTGKAIVVTTNVDEGDGQRLLSHRLVLPRVEAVMADATAANFVNRNVRGFLRGYKASGLKAAYFGGDLFVVGGHPLGRLTPHLEDDGGAVLVLQVGVDVPLLTAPSPKGKAPVALLDVAPDVDLPAFIERVDAVVRRWAGVS